MNRKQTKLHTVNRIRNSVMNFVVNFCLSGNVMLPTLSKARTVIYCFDTGIVVLILFLGKYIFSRILYLSYMQARELRCADPPSGEHIQFSLTFHKFNPLNFELNPICHFLTLLGARHILHVSRIRVKTDLSRPKLQNLKCRKLRQALHFVDSFERREVIQSRPLTAFQSFGLFFNRKLLKYFHSLHSISMSCGAVVHAFLLSNKVPVRGGFLPWTPSINTSGINTSQTGTAASFHTWHGE
jgi:hypothetical protein